MRRDSRRGLVPVLVLVSLLLGVLSVVNSVGQTPLQTFDVTPSVFVHLPIVESHPTRTPGTALIPPDDLANEQSVADQLTQQRAANGLASLTLVSELTQSARRHSRDMAENNFTGHTGSDGSNGGQRMEEAGYDWIRWGEIIGWGFGGSTESMVDWWMNSPTHRSLILSSDFDDFGVGYAFEPGSDWVHYWTVNFGRRASNVTRSSDLFVCRFEARTALGGSSLMLLSPEPCR